MREVDSCRCVCGGMCMYGRKEDGCSCACDGMCLYARACWCECEGGGAVLGAGVLDKAVLDRAVLDRAVLDRAVLDRVVLDQDRGGDDEDDEDGSSTRHRSPSFFVGFSRVSHAGAFCRLRGWSEDDGPGWVCAASLLLVSADGGGGVECFGTLALAPAPLAVLCC